MTQPMTEPKLQQHWCPWNTKVLAELPIPDDAAQHARHASAADYTELALAPGSLAVAFAPGLVQQTSVVSVTLKDSAGGQWTAAPLFTSLGSVTYQMPSGIVPGPVTAVIATSEGHQYIDSLYVLVFAPSLFSVMPPGIAAAWVTRFKADGSTSVEPVFRFDSETKTVVAAPIDLGPASDVVYLSLLGTGIRNRSGLGSPILSSTASRRWRSTPALNPRILAWTKSTWSCLVLLPVQA